MSPPPTKTPPKAPAKVPAPGIPRPAPVPRTGAAVGAFSAAKSEAKPATKAPVLEDTKATVLLVGSGDPMEAALTLALGRYGLNVESSPMKDAIQAVFVHAPDLAILLGDAAREEGGEVLAALAGRASTAVVPVALLSDDPNLEKRLRAFRFGAVAVVPRTASADEMARRIADIVKELPERDKTKGQDLGETTLEELIRLVSTRLRSGILSVKAEGQSEGARIVLRGGQPVSEAIEQLVSTIRPLVTTDAGPLAFEFEEQPTGKLGAMADAEIALPGETDIRAVLSGRRFVLIERSPTRADDLVQALRTLGAHVAVVDGEGEGMEKARAIAPEVIVVDARGIGGWASPALKTIRHDLRLRWAALLVARADEIWPEGAPGADLSRLAAGVKPLVEADLSLTERARTEPSFSARLESTGPERFLRALLSSGKTLHVRVQHNRAVVDLDLAEGLVVGGTAKSTGRSSIAPGKPVEVSGAAALAVLLGLASGRAQVEQRAAPSLANLMAPLDDAIAAADREQPPIRPSLPPPSVPPSSAPESRSPLTSALLNDPPELLRQLESLLIDLKKSLPAPSLASTAPEAGELEPGPVPISAAGPTEVPAGAPIPAPAPLPNVRKKTLVGMVSPVAGAAGPASASPAALGASAPALRAPVSVRPPPADADSLADFLEPDSAETAVPIASAELELPSPEPRPAPPSMPSRSFPRVIPDGRPLPVARGDATGPLVTPDSVVAKVPVDDEPVVLPQRRVPWGMIAAVVLLLALGGGAAYAWLVLRPSGALAGLGIGPAEGGTPVTTVPPATLPDAAAVVIAAAPDAPIALDAGAALDPGTLDAGTTLDGGTALDASELVAEGELDAGELVAEGEPDAGELFAEDDTTVDDATLTVTERRARIEYLIDRANYRRRHGEPDGAARDYEAVLRLEGSNARALAGLARLNLDRGRGADAVRYARRLVRTHASQPANHVLLGDCLLAAGDRAGAIRAFQDALRIQPSYRTARERIAHLPPR